MDLKLITHEQPLGIEISNSLNSNRYKNFKMAVAYAKNSGIGRLHNDFKNFTNNGGNIDAVIGIDQTITSYQALINLLTFTGQNLFIHHDKGPTSFHPKLYYFGNVEIEKVIIGSSNLTAGGLYLNYEVNVDINFNNSDTSNNFRNQVDDYWNKLISNTNTKIADLKLLNELLELGSLLNENKQKSFKNLIAKISKVPFSSQSRPKLPELSTQLQTEVPILKNSFSMLLSKFDVSDRSQDPVILIPIRALQKYPNFWNWPSFYTLSGSGYPELYVHTSIFYDGIEKKNHTVRLYYYDKKKEFRLQCEPIKRNGKQGDIILIEKNELKPFDFKITLIRQDSSSYDRLLPKLTEEVSPVKKYTYF
ncbi:phospholipase D family protein [candidate division KSB1 bacterium]|nr:phospholipase D family protein [candidate division KSB1 bacterium]MBL7093785.1 phospholipase D family protein [candidate division KSB1 bacterium]